MRRFFHILCKEMRFDEDPYGGFLSSLPLKSLQKNT